MTTDAAAAETDSQLLARFEKNREQPAFAELVRRHGPMVQATAMRVLANRDDADDVLQATFMALARHAGRVRRGDAVAGWLHVTAKRCALKHLRRRERERETEARAARAGDARPDSSLERADEVRLVDDEIVRLPPALRTVVVLCDLEGMSRAEAATRLGVGSSTVSERVGKAHALLRKRLSQRGVTLGATGVAGSLAASAQGGSVGPELIAGTTSASIAYASGASADLLGVSQPVIELANGAAPLMKTTAYLKLAAMAIVVFGLMNPALRVLGVAESSAFAARLPFFDDFSDGDATDGTPGTWLPGAAPGGVRDAATGDLVLSGAEADMSTLVTELDGLRDLTIAARVRFLEDSSDNDYVNVTARSPGGVSNPAAYAAGIFDQGFLYITYFSPTREGNPLAGVQTDLDPINSDVLLEFSVKDDRLALTAWEVGDPRPQTPQLITTDTNLTEGGQVGVSAGKFEGSNPDPYAVAIRFYSATPEPSGVAIATAAVIALLGFAARRS